MKELQKLNYGKFETAFYCTLKVEKFLKENHVDLKEFLPDNHHFYEVLLFENLDENEDGLPDEKFGKKFKVTYYAIRKSLVEEITEPLKHKKEDLIGEYTEVVAETASHKSFAIIYKIIKVRP